MATRKTPPEFAPPLVTTVVEDGFGRALKWSLLAHGAVVAIALLKGLIFGWSSTPYIPTLRVDLVGLPDILKKDLSKLQAPPPDEPSESAPSKEKTKQVQKADPDEMVVKPKSQKDDRAKKNQRSLDRIKALSKIQDDEVKSSSKIKGNVLSKGSSLSADARESGEENYLDTVRDRLQANWELNPLLARQKLSAQVRIFIDSRGQLRSFQFVRSSGNPAFDAAVKRTIQASSPFPKAPKASLTSLLLDGVLVGFPL